MERKHYNTAVNKYSHLLYGFALRFLQNSEDARDVVQDTFEKLWIHCDNVEEGKCKSWLFTCANNAMLNMVARKRRKELKTMIANRTTNFFAKLRRKRRNRTA